MKWISTLIFSLLLWGCSHSPSNYYVPPDTCDGAPGCAASAIIKGIVYSEPAPRKCAEKRGTQRAECDAQVDAIKDSIKQAQRN
ncbi:hypothetical protein [uncultured Shewanella sp.]|uniref:hypothetical protein n=1 Tax=uncultured Shewanella sp. TaxID=173975 RepID=UPI00260BAAF7|nr:hypothetical protein [uncultured Shewanella sp.]